MAQKHATANDCTFQKESRSRLSKWERQYYNQNKSLSKLSNLGRFWQTVSLQNDRTHYITRMTKYNTKKKTTTSILTYPTILQSSRKTITIFLRKNVAQRKRIAKRKTVSTKETAKIKTNSTFSNYVNVLNVIWVTSVDSFKSSYM